jgi:hypothetical protein
MPPIKPRRSPLAYARLSTGPAAAAAFFAAPGQRAPFARLLGIVSTVNLLNPQTTRVNLPQAARRLRSGKVPMKLA